MAIDVAGPFRPGGDQDSQNPRYFLVAVATVPCSGEKPLIEGWRPAEVESSSHEVPLENWDVIPDGEKPDPFREEQGEGEQQPAAEGEQSVHVSKEDAAKASLAERVARLKDVGVKHITLATHFSTVRSLRSLMQWPNCMPSSGCFRSRCSS